jgi:hypothetical protein
VTVDSVKHVAYGQYGTGQGPPVRKSRDSHLGPHIVERPLQHSSTARAVEPSPNPPTTTDSGPPSTAPSPSPASSISATVNRPDIRPSSPSLTSYTST